MPGKVQHLRTVTNTPPAALLEGEFAVEMGSPTRLWVGVPVAQDPSGRKLLIESDVNIITDTFLPMRIRADSSVFGIIDLNTTLESGWYPIEATSANSPFAPQLGMLQVFRRSAQILQFAYNANADTVYWYRLSLDTGATWSAWGQPWLTSPIFTGSPQAPTPPLGDRSDRIATASFVDDSVMALESFSFRYLFGQTNPTLTPIDPGDCFTNTANPQELDELWISYTTTTNLDVKAKLLQLVRPGTCLFLQDASPLTSWGYVIIDTEPVDNGTYMHVQTTPMATGNGPGTGVSGVGWLTLMHPPIVHTTLISTDDIPPLRPLPGQMWWQPSTKKSFAWYAKENRWVEI